ncbi:tyrosine-type recombinase/integrase, partial [Salmonella enterica]|uniref:tyrosine-type recombinase/integrase n=1 Tax=Salmonella enterica TaxID=28901 RepID=UPI0011388FD5
SKTGEYLSIPAPAELRLPLDNAPDGFLAGIDFKADWFRHRFAALRKKAGLPDTAKFMHLRHSACVRLARAGATVPEISAVTGHSIQTASAILKRYLPRDPEVAANAIKKMDDYHQKTRSTSTQPIDNVHANKA